MPETDLKRYRRYLVLENEHEDRRFLLEFFQETEPTAEIIFTTATAEAVTELIRRPFDVILADLETADSEGLETLYFLKEADSSVPVIILTGKSDEHYAARVLREGAQDYLVKQNFSSQLLKRSIEYAIERQKSELEIQSLSRKIIDIQEEEMGRLSRELHDEIGQSLFALKLQIQTYCSRQNESSGAAEIISYLDEIIDNTRRLSHNLSPVSLKNMGFEKAVHKLANAVTETTGRKCRVSITGLNSILPGNWDVNLYRIIHEAVRNAVKHSDAGEIFIYLTDESGFHDLVIEDDGIGFRHPVQNDEGLGLLIMKERAVLAGGVLYIESKKGFGTKIRFRFSPRR